PPAQVSVSAAADALLGIPPTTHPVTDGVTISTANYDPIAHSMTIKAASSDSVLLPLLTVPTLAVQPAPPALPIAGPPLNAAGLLNFSPLAVPPTTITVVSAQGGS